MAYAIGKKSKAISDRSGCQFPYLEMVREWNGSLVHTSEYEAKHPQLDPPYHAADPQAIQNPRADVRPGGGLVVDLDLYFWPGQFLSKTNSMQPEIDSDIINFRRQATTSVGDVTISTS